MHSVNHHREGLLPLPVRNTSVSAVRSGDLTRGREPPSPEQSQGRKGWGSERTLEPEQSASAGGLLAQAGPVAPPPQAPGQGPLVYISVIAPPKSMNKDLFKHGTFKMCFEWPPLFFLIKGIRCEAFVK